MPHDDGWVINHALLISRGQWLGTYDHFTLIKGVFPPIFLAFSSYIGVTFSEFNTALYCFACLVFTVSVRPLIKNHWLLIILFSLLLFNPMPYALHTGQRIYRIGMGQWEILLIFGCFIAIYLRNNESWKSLIKWGVLCGLSLGAFLQTREDGVWIYPFVAMAIIISTLDCCWKKPKSIKNIFIFLMPVAIAFVLGTLTILINHSYYGAPILNDRSGGNFSKVAKDLFSISPDPEDDKLFKSGAYKAEYFTIYVSTMEKAFTISPTLKSVAPEIRDAIKNWEGLEDVKVGELSTDHMLFALRDGLKAAGFYNSLPETEEFYGKVHKELQTGFETGLLVKRGFSISPLIMPMQSGDLSKTLSIMPHAIRELSAFKGVSSAAIPSLGNEFLIKETGILAGGDFYTSSGFMSGSGWAFLKGNKADLTAGLYDNQGKLITNLLFSVSDDVFKHFLLKGSKYQNAMNSRFQFKVDGYDLKSGVKIRFFDKNGLINEIAADNSAGCGEVSNLHYCIDSIKFDSSAEVFYSRFVKRANHLIALYQKFIPIFSLISLLVYFLITLILFYDVLKKKECNTCNTLPIWLILTGIIATFIVFVFGMCLIEVTSFNALVYWYTAPANLLILMFCGLSVTCGMEAVFKLKKRVTT